MGRASVSAKRKGGARRPQRLSEAQRHALGLIDLLIEFDGYVSNGGFTDAFAIPSAAPDDVVEAFAHFGMTDLAELVRSGIEAIGVPLPRNVAERDRILSADLGTAEAKLGELENAYFERTRGHDAVQERITAYLGRHPEEAPPEVEHRHTAGTIAENLEQFATLAIRQDELWRESVYRANQASHALWAVEDVLARTPEGRAAIASLMENASPSVRVAAAIFSYRAYPERSMQTLREVRGTRGPAADRAFFALSDIETHLRRQRT